MLIRINCSVPSVCNVSIVMLSLGFITGLCGVACLVSDMSFNTFDFALWAFLRGLSSNGYPVHALWYLREGRR